MNTADLVKAFTDAMTHEGVEAMMSLWATDGEWVIMATGETFKGLDKIRELATRSVAARTHGSGEGLLPFNVFTNAEGPKSAGRPSPSLCAMADIGPSLHFPGCSVMSVVGA
jgi:hypothetical protein